MSELFGRKKSTCSKQTSRKTSPAVDGWSQLYIDLQKKKKVTSRNTLKQFATSPPASGKAGLNTNREMFQEEARISQVFKKFDTKRLRDGNELDDTLREIIWENGFKIPVAPVKNKMNMYLIGSQKMVVQMRNE